MNDIEREHQIAHFNGLMQDAFSAGKRADARFYCRVMTGLVRGRTEAQIHQMEQQINAGNGVAPLSCHSRTTRALTTEWRKDA